VTDIGRKSDRQTGAGTLGTGVTKSFSQQLGTVPVLKEQLSTYATTSASSKEQLRNNHAGISSQPAAVSLVFLSNCSTSILVCGWISPLLSQRK